MPFNIVIWTIWSFISEWSEHPIGCREIGALWSGGMSGAPDHSGKWLREVFDVRPEDDRRRELYSNQSPIDQFGGFQGQKTSFMDPSDPFYRPIGHIKCPAERGKSVDVMGKWGARSEKKWKLEREQVSGRLWSEEDEEEDDEEDEHGMDARQKGANNTLEGIGDPS